MSTFSGFGAHFDQAHRAIAKYSRQKPELRWGPNDRFGVSTSRTSHWNPLKGVNISFQDDSKMFDRMWFVIELPAPSKTFQMVSIDMAPSFPISHHELTSNAIALGFFFNKNCHTGKVDLLYRLKPFKGKEHSILYRDCCFFDLDTEKIYPSVEESKFVISNECQDTVLGTGVNLCSSKYSDFAYVVQFINDFIQRTRTQTRVKAYPILKLVRMASHDYTSSADDEDEYHQRGFDPLNRQLAMAIPPSSLSGSSTHSELSIVEEEVPDNQQYVMAHVQVMSD